MTDIAPAMIADFVTDTPMTAPVVIAGSAVERNKLNSLWPRSKHFAAVLFWLIFMS
jgi:hypothetical protein